MPDQDIKPLMEALSCPVGDLIAAVGRGVAEAQRALDHASLSALTEIYSRGDGLLGELQRIGYRPTWYHIPEVESTLQIALTISGERSSGSGTSGVGANAHSRIKLYAAPVDAGYSSRYNYQLQAASTVKFKVVSVPPSNVAEEIRVMPALVGMSLADAKARLNLLGISANFPTAASESAPVTGQQPDAGTLLSSTSNVQVHIE